jgi:Ser/Thr protein kinase RdoA (MazF antagonist)
VHEGGIIVFDLSDCNYSWFAYELAVTLYHVLDLPYLGDAYDQFGAFFMQHFMQGYGQENRLDPAWAGEMNNFLRLREIHIYSYIDNNWDWAAYPEERGWMEACKHRIDNNLPIANLDFAQFFR